MYPLLKIYMVPTVFYQSYFFISSTNYIDGANDAPMEFTDIVVGPSAMWLISPLLLSDAFIS
jgi:hypothetical protein